MKTATKIKNVISNHPFLIGLSIRLLLMILLPLLMDDGILLQGVKYTDIDYDVFTDAAEHVANGQSPFMRHTYRYTPFIALILSYASSSSLPWMGLQGTTNKTFFQQFINVAVNWWRHPKYFGRLLFCIADSLCGLVILQLRQASRKKQQEKQTIAKSESRNVKIQDGLWWLYNPLPINICTRGSGESFVVLLPVLFTLATVLSASSSSFSSSHIHEKHRKKSIIYKSILAGIIHGVAIHAKLYPIIYTASFMAYLSYQEQSLWKKRDDNEVGWYYKMKPIQKNNPQIQVLEKSKQQQQQQQQQQHIGNNYPFPWLYPKRLCQLIKLWINRVLFTKSSILFLCFSLVTFAILTYLAVQYYGEEALQEGLLYHFSRVDHRHNYSMFWYWIYLARGRVVASSIPLSSSSLSTMGKALLVPQVILLLYSSLGIAPYDLPFALFIQTFSFVAQNKVITAQYFTWYLVLLPLCSDRIQWKSRNMIAALLFLGLSIVTWLGSAFCLEMKGMNVHLQVWIASVGFFIANINLLRVILDNYCGFELNLSQHYNCDVKNKKL
mmetsp:Transcript_2581/g.2913  ORF Transcript_2581/g.2913 Transcript_2581/m.2913 type:complete len:553 (+) Transcript_2581:187-1845(+)